MKRGDIVLCQVKSPYASKARPSVIVQSDEVIDTFESITICPITSTEVVDTNTFRIPITPNKTNKLKKRSFVMIDKVGSYPSNSLKAIDAKLTTAVIKKVDDALKLWLALGKT